MELEEYMKKVISYCRDCGFYPNPIAHASIARSFKRKRTVEEAANLVMYNTTKP